jgi:hypothetical protein
VHCSERSSFIISNYYFCTVYSCIVTIAFAIGTIVQGSLDTVDPLKYIITTVDSLFTILVVVVCSRAVHLEIHTATLSFEVDS